MKDKKVGDAATTVPVGPPDNGTKAEPSLPPLLSLCLSFSVSPVGLRDPYDTQKKKKWAIVDLRTSAWKKKKGMPLSSLSLPPPSSLSLPPPTAPRHSSGAASGSL